MALFKILRGSSGRFEANLANANVSPNFVDGYCYFLTGTNMFYVDYIDDTGLKHRAPLNAENANTITVERKNAQGELEYYFGAKVIDHALNSSNAEVPTSRLVKTELTRVEDTMSLKMDKENPTGTGKMSINRKSGTTAGNYSVAMGYQPTASATGAVALGYSTTANKAYATATGYSTTASGQSAHAEGQSTVASGNYSHATNLGTKATASSQTAIGKYNATDSNALFIIGNGTSDSARSNALKVATSGVVTTAATPDQMTEDKHLISKEYLKQNFQKPLHYYLKCTDGQSSFTFGDLNFSEKLHLVYFNGLLLIEGVHYQHPTNTTIEFLGWSATKNDYIQVVSFRPFLLDSKLLAA